MAKIHVLSEQLTNMIAAGEVVERPLQVVKELVENSLDAKATRIEIELKTGGIDYIRVSDNGIGMDKEDVGMAFARHATSKLSSVDQLFDISTMGFRGEAIPSIASVSYTTCISNDGSGGYRMIVDNGQTISKQAYPCVQGTTFTVEHLFAKVPARLKHLKNDRYEAALINTTIQKMALINLNVAFTLISDDKKIFESDGRGSIINTMLSVYGKDVAAALLPFHYDGFDMHIDGVIALPQYGRSNKNGITIGLNGRYIKPFKLINVIIDATKEYFPPNRYPVVLMNISMEHRLVDVNVHPGKLEVRISKENQLDTMIINALKLTLSKAGMGVTMDDHTSQRLHESQSIVAVDQPYVSEDNTSMVQSLESDDHTTSDALVKPIQPSKPHYAQETLDLSMLQASFAETAKPSSTGPVTLAEASSLFTSKLSNTTPLRVLGQIHGKFIIAEDENGLVVIDQHAAQERVHYEQFRASMTTNIDQHQLLTPILITLSQDIINGLDQLNEKLAPLGLHGDAFGPTTLAFHALPSWCKDILDPSFYEDIISSLWLDQSVAIDDLIRHKIATRACKASIRFNQYLDLYQCQAVVNQLYQCEDPYACPHGRPIMIHLSDRFLEKEFNR